MRRLLNSVLRSTESITSTVSRELIKFNGAVTVILELIERKKLRDRVRFKEVKEPCVVRYSCPCHSKFCKQK